MFFVCGNLIITITREVYFQFTQTKSPWIQGINKLLLIHTKAIISDLQTVKCIFWVY